MRRRSVRILLVAFTLVWFGAVVPGHQRGCIVLGSTTSPDEASKATVAQVPSCHRPRQAADTSHQKVPPKKALCAICVFASTIEAPPPADVLPKPTASATLSDWPTPPSAIVAHVRCFDACGPPA
jgi:hypothetical protein